MILIVERVNRFFQSATGQPSGLTVTLDMINKKLKNSLKVVVNDFHDTVYAIKKNNPKAVVTGNLDLSQAECADLTRRFPYTKFYAMVHSNTPFNANVNHTQDKIYKTIKEGFKIIFNDERCHKVFFDQVFLPNIYDTVYMPYKDKKIEDTFNVVCAGALRPFKNQLIQAIACIKYCDENNLKLNFYMNFSIKQFADIIANEIKHLFIHNPKHKLVNLPWQENRKFKESLSNFHLGMQVSLSESFNAVSADYTSAGLPMVVSNEIRWSSDSIKASCHDHTDIIEKIKIAHEFVGENQEKLKAHNDDAVKLWNGYFNS